MTPEKLLAEARAFVDTAAPGTEGLWARAAVHLARQALESAMRIRLSKRIHEIEDVAFDAQLVCLHSVADAETAARAAYVWSDLSAAAHHHGYELPPSARTLRGWIDTVGRVLEGLGLGER